MKRFVENLLGNDSEEFVSDWKIRHALALDNEIMRQHAAGLISAEKAADAMAGNVEYFLSAVAENPRLYREYSEPDKFGQTKFDQLRNVAGGYNREGES